MASISAFCRHGAFPSFSFALLLAYGASAGGQTSPAIGLPATSPTSLPAPIVATPLSGPTATKSHKAAVTYAAGLIDVRANDSSLNSILREIARLTGMTITGGVADQRVFGNYGPADPSTVLATLLDGTGTNLFMKESAEDRPAELVLTPRTGGPTPPSPTSPQYNDTDEAPPPVPAATPGPGGPPMMRLNGPSARPGYAQAPTATQQMPPLPISPGGPPSMPPPSNNVLGDPNAVSPSASTLPVTNSVPTDSLPTPSTARSVSGIVDSPSGPASGSTTAGFTAAAQANAASSTTPTNDADATGGNLPGGSTNSAGSGSAPNGVKTPEQIFEQLQQLRRSAQAQQTPQAQSGATTAAPATTGPTTQTYPVQPSGPQ